MEKELKMDKLRIGWGIRAMRYEEKLMRSKEENIMIKCWKEIEEGKWRKHMGRKE